MRFVFTVLHFEIGKFEGNHFSIYFNDGGADNSMFLQKCCQREFVVAGNDSFLLFFQFWSKTTLTAVWNMRHFQKNLLKISKIELKYFNASLCNTRY